MKEKVETYVRDVTPQEAQYEEANKKGFLLIGYYMVLSSDIVLSEDTFRQALELLHRKIPSLHLRIKENDGKYEFHKQEHFKIDFKAYKNADPIEVCRSAVSIPFTSSSGPIWRATLVLPTKEDNLPYKYHLVFVFHHANTDGTSNVIVCQQFLNILNDVIGKKPISEDTITEFCDGQWLVKSEKEAKKRLSEEKELYNKFQKRLEFFRNRTPPFQNILPQPEDTPVESRFLTRVLQKEFASKLLVKAKAEKVSFNAGFIALVDQALMEILEKYKPTSHPTHIASTQAISTRRYDKENQDKLGYQVGVVNLVVNTSSVSSDIWKHAGQIKEELLKCMEDETFSYDNAMMSLLGAEKSTEAPKVHHDYNASNMGDLSKYFSSNGPYVKLDSLFRNSNIHNAGLYFAIMFQTIHGELNLSIIYGTRLMTKIIAEEFADKLMQKIKDL